MHARSWSGPTLVLLALCVAPRCAGAAGPLFVKEAQLFGHVDPNGQPGHNQGAAVAVDGDTAVLGAPSLDGTALGTAYVFVRTGSTWTQQQRLAAANTTQPACFGCAVALSGDTLVVGDPYAETAAGMLAGRVYVFVRSGSTWSLQQEITATNSVGFRYFGWSVSISGDILAIGAPGSGTGAAPGSTYVYVRTGTSWTLQQELTAGAAADLFGYSVSLDGDTVMTGAPDSFGGGNGAAYAFVRNGTTWAMEQRLDGPFLTRFGTSVALAADTAVVTAPFEDTAAGNDAGAAHVFARSSGFWTEQQVLTPSDAAAGDVFGTDVSMSVDTIVVGADVRSRAYAFVRSGTDWTQQELLPSDAPQPSFGWAVSVSGDTAFVGVPNGTPDASYAFVRTGATWAEQQKVRSTDTTNGDVLFGRSASIDGDTLAVGVTTYDGETNAARVFVRAGITWTEQQELTASDPEPNSDFGLAVALSGDTLVVGAPGEDGPAGLESGAAYVFVRTGTTWTEQQKLTASDASAYLGLGFSVGIDGDTVVLGTLSAHPTGPGGPGSAYVFVRSGTTWSEEQKLTASDGSTDDYFGQSVSIVGDTVVVAARGADLPAMANAGAAYVFVRQGTTWSEQQKLTASDAGIDHFLGSAVSISGDTTLVGRTLADGLTDAVYVFVRSGTAWSQQQKLTSNDTPSAEFGSAISVSGDTALIGAPYAPGAATEYLGAAYVFLRSGTAWSQGQMLQADLATADGYDRFGAAVSMSGDTLLVGVPQDDIPYNVDTGSAYTFRQLQADLSITKTDGQAAAVPGGPVTYTITVSNAGPLAVPGASVLDTPPAALSGASWTCSASAGSSCTAGGTGGISDMSSLLVGGTATYTLTASIDPAATGTLANTATVAIPPGGTDPDAGNDSATDTDTLTPVADLAVTKTDGQTAAVPGQAVSYTITATNAGPSVAAGALVADAIPATLQGATWTCSASPGSSCAASGSGGISDTVTALVGASLTYTLTGTVDPAATLILVNTASVAPAAGASDPAMANNAATDVDALPVGFPTDGELANGYDRRHDLAALPGPVADEDVFRIYQQPHASFEVLVDGVSGDLGVGSGPLLERLASDASTVLQASSPAGAGGSRSLCWMNALDHAVAEEFVRVRSAGCTTDCDANDVYRLRARETTGFIPRFNNSGSQVTVLVLGNAGEQAIDVDIRLWSQAGVLLGGTTTSIAPRAAYVLNTSTVAPGSGGSMTIASTGRYGQLAGKAVAVEPGTGFTFDTVLELRSW
jgi:uncharacterized repeat protein (TIGR01451 family)